MNNTPAPSFTAPAVAVVVTERAPDRRVWSAVRQALLLIVGAIEEYLEIPPAKSALVARRLK